MAGRMGGKRVTQVGLTVHSVEPEQNLLLVKGAVPGPKNGIVEIREQNVVAAPKAPTLGGTKQVTLEEAVFAAEVKPHLVHEAVRAELNAHRAGTRAAKSRGSSPAAAASRGARRAPAVPARARFALRSSRAAASCSRRRRARFDVKVNKKAYRSALRSALSSHAEDGTLAIVDPVAFDEPSTTHRARPARGVGQGPPAGRRRCLPTRRPSSSRSAISTASLVVEPAEVEVATIVWARALVVTEDALELLQRRAS